HDYMGEWNHAQHPRTNVAMHYRSNSLVRSWVEIERFSGWSCWQRRPPSRRSPSNKVSSKSRLMGPAEGNPITDVRFTSAFRQAMETSRSYTWSISYPMPT